MKKILSLATVVILCLMLMLPMAMSVSAAAPSAALGAPTTVREGETFTVVFHLGGTNLSGLSGVLKYDSKQLQLVGTKQSIAAPWVVEFSGNNFLAYDNNLSKPINKLTAVFSAQFRVKAAAGTKISVSFSDILASDGQKEYAMSGPVFSTTVAEPKSGDNTLASLTADGATLSPVFRADTTSYTATVPFDVTKLNVTATASDDNAKVSVFSPKLTAGGTTNVTVTVTAEDGSKKVYTIAVTREQDPNYKASSNNSLSDITIDGFVLSPGFDQQVTEYVVWLPFETDSITVSGTAAHGKASVEVVGGKDLQAGQDNIVTIICTAEDGTKKEYTLIAKRAAEHGAEEPPEETPGDEQPGEEDPKQEEPTVTEPQEEQGFPLWMLIAAAAAGLAIGLVIGLVILFVTKKSKKA